MKMTSYNLSRLIVTMWLIAWLCSYFFSWGFGAGIIILSQMPMMALVIKASAFKKLAWIIMSLWVAALVSAFFDTTIATSIFGVSQAPMMLLAVITFIRGRPRESTDSA